MRFRYLCPTCRWARRLGLMESYQETVLCASRSRLLDMPPQSRMASLRPSLCLRLDPGQVSLEVDSMDAMRTSDQQDGMQQFFETHHRFIARAEADGCISGCLTGTSEGIWQTSHNELTVTDFPFHCIQDAGATMSAAFDPICRWPD